MFFNKRPRLLPYVEEPVFGMSTKSPQFFGWEIKKFNVDDIWQISQGEGVKVAVIDTGCDLEHEDLKDNLLDGKNFVQRNSSPQDKNGHGSHVAGTIAASNNGLGMVGVAPKAKIIPIKSLDDNGSGRPDWIADGIFYAADRGADIITMSLGSMGSTPVFERAINYAVSKGSVVFCAAGNSGPGVEIMFPARYDNTISIGAIDANLNRTNFTCSGESLDFLAPGHDIVSCIPGNRYSRMSGTSMSNPFVAGCAALLCSYYKSKNKESINHKNTYIQKMSKGAMHLTNPEYSNQKKYEGYGIINPNSFKEWIK